MTEATELACIYTYIKTNEELLLVCLVFVTCNKRSYQICGKLCIIYTTFLYNQKGNRYVNSVWLGSSKKYEQGLSTPSMSGMHSIIK